MKNTPRSNKVEALTPPDALGRVAIEFSKKLEVENEKLRTFISDWIYEGQLQAYESRETFRAAARKLLDN